MKPWVKAEQDGDGVVVRWWRSQHSIAMETRAGSGGGAVARWREEVQ